jgi:uncharacterized membrane protein YhaH (DUF805 family)
MRERQAPSKDELSVWALAVAPFGFAILGPFVPLLIIFAGTLPATAPHPPMAFALLLAALSTLILCVAGVGLCVRGVHRFPKSMWIPLSALVAAQLLALGWALYPKVAIFSLIATLAGYVMLICTTETLAATRTRRAFLACYLISAAIAALIACAFSVMKLPP